MVRKLLLLTLLVLAYMPARGNTLAVIRSAPAEGATSVGLNTTVSFSFNNPVDPWEIGESFVVAPENAIEVGEATVSEDGRVITFEVTHMSGTDYTWILSGAYEDGVTGEITAIDPFVLRYSTSSAMGTALVSGEIGVLGEVAGKATAESRSAPRFVPSTALMRHLQQSAREAVRGGTPTFDRTEARSLRTDTDPTGTIVVLSTIDPISSSEDEGLAGAAVVYGVSGAYEVPFVRPGTYYPYAMRVGAVDEGAPLGDYLASMYFGYYDPDGDGIPNAITVDAGGAVTGIDFMVAPLSAFAGTASEMEETAREAADAYAPDQQLMGITAHGVGSEGKSATWTFHYYSPSTEMQSDVTVTPFDVEVLQMEYPGQEPPAALPQPYADSDEVFLTGLLNGGEEFLQRNPAAFVSMAAGILEVPVGEGPGVDEPYWAVAFVSFAPTRIDWIVVYADFVTGEFIGSERSEPAAGRYSDRFQEALAEISELEGDFVLVGIHGEDLTTDGVAAEWQFDFYAENTDTRAIVSVSEGYARTDSEKPAGQPELMTLGGSIIDSDVAITAAMEQGGNDFVEENGLSRILIDAGDLSWMYEWLDAPAYLVTFYGAGAPGELWYRAVLDPINGALLYSERSDDTASEPEPEVPSVIELGAGYPNPFNPQTTIPFRLAAPARARLSVHDALGREVALLVDGSVPQGEHHVSWDASNLPSGVYFYRLSAAGQTETGTVILQK